MYANIIRSLSPCQIWLGQARTLIPAQSRHAAHTGHGCMHAGSLSVWFCVQHFHDWLRLPWTISSSSSSRWLRLLVRHFIWKPFSYIKSSVSILNKVVCSLGCSRITCLASRFWLARCDRQVGERTRALLSNTNAHTREAKLFQKMLRQTQSHLKLSLINHYWLGAGFRLDTLYNITQPRLQCSDDINRGECNNSSNDRNPWKWGRRRGRNISPLCFKKYEVDLLHYVIIYSLFSLSDMIRSAAYGYIDFWSAAQSRLTPATAASLPALYLCAVCCVHHFHDWLRLQSRMM